MAAAVAGFPPDIPTAVAILLLDGAVGTRIVAKYFDSGAFADLKAENAFEKRVFKKARAAPTGDDAEVAIVDEYTCVYRTVNDLVAVVVGEGSENELLLEAALDAILSALELLLKKGVVKAQVYKFLPRVLLSIDEVLDAGMILSLSPSGVADRVMLKGAVPEALSSYSEFTVRSAFEKAREIASKQFGNAQ
ncbi:hypothetical protein FNF27_04399 [Cafeteria roenbergensis]|uniref:Coatomer subunit zeta n=2 Tax=Cafeteria roenbergensis TaxID=33653 RepID=A0A5A8EA81_CAFRO|nr:hypothetical protein FNF27_04399 [Cafeteria roenbergensis]